MSIRMFAKRMSHVIVPSGGDRALFGVSLPSGSVIHDIRAKISKQQVGSHAIAAATMQAVEIWLLPVHDPDAAPTIDALWDTLVPKDQDAEVLDLDTAATDTTPFYEPGEPDLSQLFDLGLRPERLYHSHRMHTLASGAIHSFQDNQTPFLNLWVAGENQRIHIGKRLHISQPMVLVCGMAAPALDDTTTTVPQALGEPSWGRVKYLGHVLEMALMDVLGLTESGAETPFEDATLLLKAHLEPDVFEETGGAFAQANWNVFTEAMVDMSTIGELGKVAVSTGR